MSLIRTDYVPEWRISAHAQSVLAAGQKHHNNLPSIITPKGKSYRVDFAFMEITTENVTGCLLKINAAKYTDPDGSTPNF